MRNLFKGTSKLIWNTQCSSLQLNVNRIEKTNRQLFTSFDQFLQEPHFMEVWNGTILRNEFRSPANIKDKESQDINNGQGYLKQRVNDLKQQSGTLPLYAAMPFLAQNLLAVHVSHKIFVIVFNGQSQSWVLHFFRKSEIFCGPCTFFQKSLNLKGILNWKLLNRCSTKNSKIKYILTVHSSKRPTDNWEHCWEISKYSSLNSGTFSA